MNIIYPRNLLIPKERAHVIQILNTCNSLGKLGINVDLAINNIKVSKLYLLKQYGISNANFKIIELNPKFWIINKYLLDKIFNEKIFFIFLLIKMIINKIKNKENRYDVLYSRESFLSSFQIKILKKLFKIKIINEYHDISYKVNKYDYSSIMRTKNSKKNKDFSKYKKQKTREKKIIESIDGVVAITKNLKYQIINELKTEKQILVAHDGTNYFKPKNVQKKHNKKINIGYIGSLYLWKGVDDLVKSMKYLDSKYKLNIVGGTSGKYKDIVMATEKKALISQIKENQLQNRITFAGYVPYNKIWKYICRNDVVVIPLKKNFKSAYCTSSLKQFDYMMAKVPIVVSNLPSTREIFIHKKNAILVEPENPKAIADGIKIIIENEELKKRIVKQAYKDVQEYTWDKRAERIKQYIDRI